MSEPYMRPQPGCPECGRWDDGAGHDCEVVPRCDICGETEWCGVDGCPMCSSDWNGETGRHLTCERRAQLDIENDPAAAQERGL